jgi:hypothetical protein
MCVLVAHLHRVPGYPLVVAANRDEALDRPSAPPTLSNDGRCFAPRDLVAGGTWLGINRDGLLAVVTNRSREFIDADRASRGELCRLALASTSADQAVDRIVDAVHRAPRNGFNLLVADHLSARVLSGSDAVAVRQLDAGTHVLTNLHEPDAFEIDDLPPPGDVDTTLEQFAVICRDHRDRDGYQICKHGDGYGTVSSALIALGDGIAGPSRFLFADGPPCRTPHEDVGSPVRTWSAKAAG